MITLINKTQTAKLAAFVAGSTLLLVSVFAFLPAQAQTVSTLNNSASSSTLGNLQAQIAALQAQLAALLAAQGGSTTGAFLVNLTIGSRGTDVVNLQNFLISHGYAIPAGATGYFGVQTRGAVAAFQAANGIVPAVGFFGPITRTHVNAMITVITPTPTPGTGNGGAIVLHGGEARITNFNLLPEDGTLHENDSGVKIATAEFDVNGGDINVQRAQLEFQATNISDTVRPWKYFHTISVWQGGMKLASIDASNQDNWSRSTDDSSHSASSADYYMIEVPGINGVIRDGNTADLTFTADAQSTIDSTDLGQTFRIDVPSQGIRALDAAGIQEYTGSTGDTVTLGFDAAQNGKLTVSEASSDPVAGVLVADTTSESDSFNVLAFNMRNSQSSDTRVTDLTFNVATGTASGGAANIGSIIRTANLNLAGHTYRGDVNTNNTVTFHDMNAIVSGNSTQTGTLAVTLYGQQSHFAATGESLQFSLPSTGITAEGVSTGDNVPSSNLAGTANGHTQSISVSGGITVAQNSNNAVLTYNSVSPASSYGTFTVKFNVTAVGNQDVYIPKTLAATTGSTTNAGVVYDPDMLTSTSGGAVTASLTTTAPSDNSNFYVVHSGNTETFTMTVTVNPSTTNDFEVGLDMIKFSTTDADLNHLQTLDVDQSQNGFHTDPLHIPNS